MKLTGCRVAGQQISCAFPVYNYDTEIVNVILDAASTFPVKYWTCT